MNRRAGYPLLKQGNLLCTRAAFGCVDRPLSVTAKLLIDTGASYTMLSTRLLRAIAEEVPTALRQQNVFTANGTVQRPVIEIPWINCLGTQIESFPVLVCDLPTRTLIDGVIGMDFLDACGAVIDVRKATLYAD